MTSTDPRLEAAVKAWDHHWGDRYGDEAMAEMGEEVAVALEAADAVDPLRTPKATEDLEIVNGWLVERVEGNFIPGYGYEPGSEAMPLLHLEQVKGWMEFSEEDIERAARAVHDLGCATHPIPWERRDEEVQGLYREDVRAVVSALRGES